MARGSPGRARTPARRRPRQILALGGGGFTEEPDNPALDEYVLASSGRDRPRVCFMATAGGDNPSYTVKLYNAFSGGHCDPSHLALFNRTVDDARALLLAQDVIYVGGGNTVNLLAVWRAQGIDAILREAWERGVVLAGLCAGSMCWFEAGVTASFGRRLTALDDGLGFLRAATARTTGRAAMPTPRRCTPACSPASRPTTASPCTSWTGGSRP
jgi:dipeptidase E